MKAEEPKVLRFPPGIFECHRALNRLRRFKDLTRHHLHRSQDATQSLAELLPKNTPADRQQKALVAEINRLIPLVATALQAGRVVADIAWTERNERLDVPTEERHHAHLISDYFYLYERGTVHFQPMLVAVLDQGRGVYEMYRSASIRRKLNPISWIGFLVSVPVRVLIDAGLLSSERDEDTTVLKWVLGGVQAGWVALVAYLMKLAAEHDWIAPVLNRLFD